jgi:hypothetical protein
MKFSVLRNEIENDQSVLASGVAPKTQSDAVQEIQEKFLKDIYGGGFNAFGAFNKAF